eukprot:TRINITY_DN3019_c2_g2_i1.p1 TRINITY_DN3019_c2_g2~~TRINITY_DN3019_c2_g2_i1.p1  ORF type:complete len:696 (+),score=137.70 TRINITY_DN3019_c2_g2_i1:75-2162(+)
MSTALALVASVVASSLPTGIPSDWVKDYENADLMFSDRSSEQYMPEVGNGNIAAAMLSDTMYMAGVFCGHTPPLSKGQTLSHRAGLTSPIKGLLKTPTTNQVHALHIRKGMFLSRYTLKDDSQLEMRYYAHRTNKSLLVTEFNWWGNSDETTIEFESPKPVCSKCFGNEIINTTQSTYGLVTTWTATTQGTETNGTTVTVSMSYVVGTQKLQIKNATSVVFLSAFRNTLDSNTPGLDSLSDWLAGMKTAVPQLHDSHVTEWKELWTGGLEVDRFDVARAFNTSMYFILSSVRNDVHHSLSPGGLASDGYWGHSFWDCETWMYPAMLLFQPAIASSLLQYRFERIPAAENKASSKGYEGTNFPWESAFTGDEVCNDVEGTYEQHINGDIALAVKQYYYMTGDKVWLKNYGYPLLKGIADFWASRVVFDSSGNAHINNIQPPDEWALNKNDSVYTNYGAAASLKFASEASLIVTGAANPLWTHVAEKLVVPSYSTKLGLSIHPEYEGYDGGKIKQADAILLGFPFDLPMNESLRRNDLNFYLNVTTTSGPAMTWGMFSIGFIEVGDADGAAATFNQSFANVKEPYLVWTETPHGGAVNFITGAGGWLQTALMGYSGLRIRSDHLLINPQVIIHSAFNKIRGLRYKEAILDITITLSDVTFTVQNGAQLSITDVKTAKKVDTSTHITLPLTAYTIEVL